MRHINSARCWGSAVAAGLLFFLGCGGSQPISAPTKYEVWEANDDAFTIQYPADWEADGGGKQGTQWAEFVKGGARISVSVGTADSLLGDIGGNTRFGVDEDESLEAVTQIHDMRKELMAEEYSGYTETSAGNLNTTLGRARKAEFTASKGLGGKLHGYHVTALGRDFRVTVICTCPEDNWTVLQPAFDKIITELQ